MSAQVLQFPQPKPKALCDCGCGKFFSIRSTTEIWNDLREAVMLEDSEYAADLIEELQESEHHE